MMTWNETPPPMPRPMPPGIPPIAPAQLTDDSLRRSHPVQAAIDASVFAISALSHAFEWKDYVTTYKTFLSAAPELRPSTEHFLIKERHSHTSALQIVEAIRYWQDKAKAVSMHPEIKRFLNEAEQFIYIEATRLAEYSVNPRPQGYPMPVLAEDLRQPTGYVPFAPVIPASTRALLKDEMAKEIRQAYLDRKETPMPWEDALRQASFSFEEGGRPMRFGSGWPPSAPAAPPSSGQYAAAAAAPGGWGR